MVYSKFNSKGRCQEEEQSLVDAKDYENRCQAATANTSSIRVLGASVENTKIIGLEQESNDPTIRQAMIYKGSWQKEILTLLVSMVVLSKSKRVEIGKSQSVRTLTGRSKTH